VSSVGNVDTWKIPVQCPKCGIKKEVTLGQIKKGATIQCVVCATKIGLKDKNGNVAKRTKEVQDAIDSLEKTVKKIGGSLKTK
jgi:DNA-directed RNA polymerase subunit RPC12/RpoP